MTSPTALRRLVHSRKFLRLVTLALAGGFSCATIISAEDAKPPEVAPAPTADIPATPAVTEPSPDPASSLPTESGVLLPPPSAVPVDPLLPVDPFPAVPDDTALPNSSDSSPAAEDDTSSINGFSPWGPLSGIDLDAELGGASDVPNALGGFGGNFGQGGPGGRPTGFMGPSAMSLPRFEDVTGRLSRGLGLSASLSGAYDSNPSLGYGAVDDAGEGDFSMTLGGALSYQSQLANWGYNVNYSGGYNEYFSQSDLSGYYQSAGGGVNYSSGPLSASLTLGFGYGSGANRNYAAVVDELSVSYGLSASYTISAKTSISGNFSQTLTSASGGGASDSGSFGAGLTAFWRYSPLLQFGPGLAYTYTAGDVGQSRTSIGPTINANYRLSRKLSLNSQVGLNFAEYEDGESPDPGLTTSIALAYEASRLWGMNLSLYRGVQADASAAGQEQFSEMTSLRVGYNRRIRRASWNLGISYGSDTYEAPETVVTTRPDQDNISFDTSIGMPIFANTCSASLFFRYSDESGSTGNEQTDSYSVGFSISRSF